MIHYNKLIRDNVPELMQKKDKKIQYHAAGSEQEFWSVLMRKLQEEMNEFEKEPTMEQYIDILDVIDEIARAKNFDLKELKALREQKNIEQGGFEKRWVLDESPEEIGHRQEQGI
ncbi:MAG: hypothetical protein K0S38_294 [Candidatus Paceibacter sp.]|jgi:predicted house-cleaning noncanonical NTP pyrophosphatase (MazG superfamily)|nr:hypothetical protein [Candidatus Paceibacter sp.]